MLTQIIEIKGVWFAHFGSEENGAVYYSKDRATWELYRPENFNQITNEGGLSYGN